MDDMGDIVKEFLVESYENLDQLDQDFVELEASPESKEVLSRIFRTIHTIKGTCGFLSFNKLEKVSHSGESLLSLLRAGLGPRARPAKTMLKRVWCGGVGGVA